MSLRADEAPGGGVTLDFESDDIREARKKKARSIPGELLKSKNFSDNVHCDSFNHSFIAIVMHTPIKA